MQPLITPTALSAFAPHCDAATIAPLLDAQAWRAEITTGLRISHWMAQMAVECAYFTHFEENLNYSAEGLTATWPARFPAGIAPSFAHQPQKIANRTYASRMGNSDEASGDGWTFRGRGLLDHTGRRAYLALQLATGLPLLANPDLLVTDLANAALAAAAFWTAGKISALSDANNIEAVTEAVNGGLIGLPARQHAFDAARQIWVG